MAGVIIGPLKWSGGRDDEGNRTYDVTWKVQAQFGDGPATIMQTPGLYRVGSPWSLDGDVDVWAYCQPGMTVKPVYDDETCDLWTVEQKFSTKPMKRCLGTSDNSILDPLLEPQKVSGESIDDKEEATQDRYGNLLVNSAWELMRGPSVEFSKSRHKIKIEQNVSTLQSELWGPMQNTLNDRPLWGYPARCVKLHHVSWERKYYGFCYKYFTRVFEFDTAVGIHPKHGTTISEFDRDIGDEATKCLEGDWSPGGNYTVKKIGGQDANPLNPAHFKKFKDRQGANTHVILDGRGVPYIPDPPTVIVGTAPNQIHVPQYYDVSGFKGVLTKFNCRLTFSGTGGNLVWTGSPNNDPAQGTITLQLNLSDVPPTYTLTSNALDGRWVIFADSWDTLGSNSLGGDISQPPSSNEPSSVSVTPTGTTSPGNRHVEYYGESNFLLLGIPLVL